MHYKDLSHCGYFDDGRTDYQHFNIAAIGWIDTAYSDGKDTCSKCGFHRADRTACLSCDSVFPKRILPDFNKGPVSPDVVARIEKLAKATEEIFRYMGSHTCALCEQTGNRDVRSWKNVFVPTPDKIYCYPELLPHYITVHGYAPPQEFIDAINVCPVYGTDAYWEPIKRISPDLWDMELVRRGVIKSKDTAAAKRYATVRHTNTSVEPPKEEISTERKAELWEKFKRNVLSRKR